MDTSRDTERTFCTHFSVEGSHFSPGDPRVVVDVAVQLREVPEVGDGIDDHLQLVVQVEPGGGKDNLSSVQRDEVLLSFGAKGRRRGRVLNLSSPKCSEAFYSQVTA